MPQPPITVTTYWCPQCRSHYMHDLGFGHLTQTVPARRCGSGLEPLVWYR